MLVTHQSKLRLQNCVCFYTASVDAGLSRSAKAVSRLSNLCCWYQPASDDRLEGDADERHSDSVRRQCPVHGARRTIATWQL
jgi:hypothetical protein